MPGMKLIAVVLIVVGAGLIVWGFQMSDSLGSQVSETLTGSPMDGVMTRYISGAAALAAGAYLFFRK